MSFWLVFLARRQHGARSKSEQVAFAGLAPAHASRARGRAAGRNHGALCAHPARCGRRCDGRPATPSHPVGLCLGAERRISGQHRARVQYLRRTQAASHQKLVVYWLVGSRRDACHSLALGGAQPHRVRAGSACGSLGSRSVRPTAALGCDRLSAVARRRVPRGGLRARLLGARTLPSRSARAWLRHSFAHQCRRQACHVRQRLPTAHARCGGRGSADSARGRTRVCRRVARCAHRGAARRALVRRPCGTRNPVSARGGEGHAPLSTRSAGGGVASWLETQAASNRLVGL